jgi:hypothetical protein
MDPKEVEGGILALCAATGLDNPAVTCRVSRDGPSRWFISGRRNWFWVYGAGPTFAAALADVRVVEADYDLDDEGAE